MTWAGSNEGDVLYSGNVKIAFSKIGSKDVKVIQSSSKYVDGTNAQTINASRELIKKIKNQYDGKPDLLLIGDILCSNASGINIYYMNNGVLKQIQTIPTVGETHISRHLLCADLLQ